MHIRAASIRDFPQILDLYAYGRRFMAEHGNASQWQGGYPSEKLIREDILRGRSHLCFEGEEPLGIFCLCPAPDPNYARIIDGAWRSASPYMAVHRIVCRGGGTGTFCIRWCQQQFSHLRIDTHENNLPMQGLLTKCGFVPCGTIFVEDGTPRRAYEYLGE